MLSFFVIPSSFFFGLANAAAREIWALGMDKVIPVRDVEVAALGHDTRAISSLASYLPNYYRIMNDVSFFATKISHLEFHRMDASYGGCNYVVRDPCTQYLPGLHIPDRQPRHHPAIMFFWQEQETQFFSSIPKTSEPNILQSDLLG